PVRSPPRGCGPASDSVAPLPAHRLLPADPHGRPGRVVAGGDLVRGVVAGEPSPPVHRVVDCPGAVRLDGREDRLGGLLVLVVARGYLVDEGLRPRAQVIPPVLPVGGAPLGVRQELDDPVGLLGGAVLEEPGVCEPDADVGGGRDGRHVSLSFESPGRCLGAGCSGVSVTACTPLSTPRRRLQAPTLTFFEAPVDFPGGRTARGNPGPGSGRRSATCPAPGSGLLRGRSAPRPPGRGALRPCAGVPGGSPNRSSGRHGGARRACWRAVGPSLSSCAADCSAGNERIGRWVSRVHLSQGTVVAVERERSLFANRRV